MYADVCYLDREVEIIIRTTVLPTGTKISTETNTKNPTKPEE